MIIGSAFAWADLELAIHSQRVLTIDLLKSKESLMQILSRTVMMIPVLFLPGCVESIPPLETSQEQQPTKVEKVVAVEHQPEPKPMKLPVEEKPPQPSPEEMAREKLKRGLDAWVFGDSFKQFGKDHPDINFFDTDWGFGEALLSYEIGQCRMDVSLREDGSKFS